jgi:hypothetical protein
MGRKNMGIGRIWGMVRVWQHDEHTDSVTIG